MYALKQRTSGKSCVQVNGLWIQSGPILVLFGKGHYIYGLIMSDLLQVALSVLAAIFFMIGAMHMAS